MTYSAGLLTTSVPGLDAVLGGGITGHELVFIVGAPGAGKTVLASQIIFSAAQRGTRTLIITAYSESPVKLLSHLRGFSFYDETLVGTMVTVFTLPTLVGSSPDEAAQLIGRTIRESNAELILIDGFQGFAPFLESSTPPHQVLATLSTQLLYLKATILLTMAGDAHDPVNYSSLTTADITIGLTFTTTDQQHRRVLEVVKRRGRAQLSGQHAYRITPQGVVVFPRLEVYPPLGNQPVSAGRAPFGLAELDALLGGGLTAGTSTLLAGAPGTGKTSLALHWILRQDDPHDHAVYVSFQERPEQLARKASDFAFDLHSRHTAGAITLLHFEPTELAPDLVAQQLLDAINAKPTRRVVIDSLGPLLRVLEKRAPSFVAALAAQFYSAGITSLILHEINPFVGFQINLTDTPIAGLGENLIMLQQQEMQGVLRRLLAVVRMRFSDYDRTVRELVLDTAGIRVLASMESGRSMLQVASDDKGGASSPSA